MFQLSLVLRYKTRQQLPDFFSLDVCACACQFSKSVICGTSCLVTWLPELIVLSVAALNSTVHAYVYVNIHAKSVVHLDV